ncbi:hypothetical protein GUI12_03385 [Anaplasmataceae bacterium AB001_6]|nr:hypothetical protein GUI12_03385 [Anaplasmataceae bacterium AB001_6]
MYPTNRRPSTRTVNSARQPIRNPILNNLAAVHQPQPQYQYQFQYQPQYQYQLQYQPQPRDVVVTQPQSIHRRSYDNVDGTRSPNTEGENETLGYCAQGLLYAHDTTKAALLNSNTSDACTDFIPAITRSTCFSIPAAALGSVAILGVQPGLLAPAMFCTFGTAHYACLGASRLACAPVEMKTLNNPNKATTKSVLWNAAKDIATGVAESVPGVACCLETKVLNSRRADRNDQIEEQNKEIRDFNRQMGAIDLEQGTKEKLDEDIGNPALALCGVICIGCGKAYEHHNDPRRVAAREEGATQAAREHRTAIALHDTYGSSGTSYGR